jgi:hypothetical protein
VSGERLMQVVRAGGARAQPEQVEERCELCGEPIAPEHRHIVDLQSRELLCACRPCTILFDGAAAGGGHFRLVPDRRLRLADFELDDLRWASLQIPVDMAFFFRNSQAERVMALYPSPAGATESLLELESWEEIERANAVLASLEPDVEALLVNRSRGARGYYIVPIDDCYTLVALIRTHWRGFTGGSEVWEQIKAFFAGLDERAKTVMSESEEGAWR